MYYSAAAGERPDDGTKSGMDGTGVSQDGGISSNSDGRGSEDCGMSKSVVEIPVGGKPKPGFPPTLETRAQYRTRSYIARRWYSIQK